MAPGENEQPPRLPESEDADRREQQPPQPKKLEDYSIAELEAEKEALSRSRDWKRHRGRINAIDAVLLRREIEEARGRDLAKPMSGVTDGSPEEQPIAQPEPAAEPVAAEPERIEPRRQEHGAREKLLRTLREDALAELAHRAQLDPAERETRRQAIQQASGVELVPHFSGDGSFIDVTYELLGVGPHGASHPIRGPRLAAGDFGPIQHLAREHPDEVRELLSDSFNQKERALKAEVADIAKQLEDRQRLLSTARSKRQREELEKDIELDQRRLTARQRILARLSSYQQRLSHGENLFHEPPSAPRAEHVEVRTAVPPREEAVSEPAADRLATPEPRGVVLPDQRTKESAEEEALPTEFAMPAGPEADAPETPGDITEEQIAAAEGRYYRRLFGLPETASQSELEERLREKRLARLGLPADADAATIGQAEAAWQQREAALSEIEDPDNDNQLRPYYELYGLPVGSGIEAIQEQQQLVQLEREGLPTAFRGVEPAVGEAPAAAPERTAPPIEEGATIEAAAEDAERSERFKREFLEVVRQQAYADLSARSSMTPEAVAERRNEIDRATGVIIKPQFQSDGRLNTITHYLVSTDSTGRETWVSDWHPEGEFGPIVAIMERFPREGRRLLSDALTVEMWRNEEFCTFLEGDLAKKQQELDGSSNEEERASIRRLMDDRQEVLERTRAALATMPGVLDRLARGENILERVPSEVTPERPAAVESGTPIEAPAADAAREEADAVVRIAGELRGQSEEALYLESREVGRTVVDLEQERASTTDPDRQRAIDEQLRTARHRLLAIRSVLSERRTGAAAAERPETSGELQEQLADRLLGDVSLRDRLTHRGELNVLRQWRDRAAADRTSEEDGTVWRILADLYHERCERTESPEDAAALRDSYIEMVRGETAVPLGTRTDVDILDSIARNLSVEDGLAAFEELDRRLGNTRVTKRRGAPDSGRRLGDVIGEQLLAKVRTRLTQEEGKPTRARIGDPAMFGKLEGIMDGPETPETLEHRIRAADMAIRLLRGERTIQDAEEVLRRHTADTVIIKRSAYARAVMGRGQVFGRTSDDDLAQNRTEYEAAIQASMGDRVNELRRVLGQLPDRAPASPEAAAQAQAEIVNAILQHRFEEESKLRHTMRSPEESRAFQQFKQWWRKHAKARVAVGAMLTGASVASIWAGNPLASGAFQLARSAVSGTSTAMAAEGTWEKLRERFGDTKTLTAEEVQGLSDAEITRRIAAHSVRSIDYGPGVYAQMRGKSDTLTQLMSQRQRRKEQELTTEALKMREAGRSPDETVEALMLHGLAQEHEWHQAFETRKDRDRKMAMAKWTVSVGSGMIVGGLTGTAGFVRMAHALDVSAKEAAEHTAGAVAGQADSAAEAGYGVGEAAAPDTVPGAAAAGPDTLDEQLRSGIADSLKPHEAAADATADTASADSVGHAASPDTLHTTPPAPEAPEPAPVDSTTSDAGKIRELYEGQADDATIEKGEGIEHALRRQLEAAPEKFGFHGEPTDTDAVHEWSGGEAHRIALHEGLVDADGSEVRVAFDADQPTRFLLDADGSVHGLHAETYAFEPERAAEAVASGAPEAAPETAIGVDPAIEVDATPEARSALADYGVRFEGKHLWIGDKEFLLEHELAGADHDVTERVQMEIVDNNLHLNCIDADGSMDSFVIGKGGTIIETAGVEGYDHIAPEIATEAMTADTPIELSEKAESAYDNLKKTFTTLASGLDKKTALELQRDVDSQPARHALKRSVIEKFIDQQEGADHAFAKKYAKALENLFKRLPKDAIGEHDTIGSVLRRVAVRGVPPKVVAV